MPIIIDKKIDKKSVDKKSWTTLLMGLVYARNYDSMMQNINK